MRAKRARDLPESKPEHCFYIVRSRSLTEGIGTDPMIAVGGQNQPAGIHLGDFLLQRHPTQQIGDPLRDR
jgi:hypothetical protein